MSNVTVARSRVTEAQAALKAAQAALDNAQRTVNKPWKYKTGLKVGMDGIVGTLFGVRTIYLDSDGKIRCYLPSGKRPLYRNSDGTCTGLTHYGIPKNKFVFLGVKS